MLEISQPRSIIQRQHFQQFNFEDQFRIRRDLARDAFALGQVRRHQQLAFATDLHAHDPLIATFFYMTLIFYRLSIQRAA